MILANLHYDQLLHVHQTLCVELLVNPGSSVQVIYQDPKQVKFSIAQVTIATADPCLLGLRANVGCHKMRYYIFH